MRTVDDAVLDSESRRFRGRSKTSPSDDSDPDELLLLDFGLGLGLVLELEVVRGVSSREGLSWREGLSPMVFSPSVRSRNRRSILRSDISADYQRPAICGKILAQRKYSVVLEGS